jgi:hypothetical protein
MRFQRQETNLVLGSALSVALLLGSGLTATTTIAPAASEDPAPNDGRQLMSGTVVRPDGTPAKMADITVHVETQTEFGSLSTPIAEGRTTPTGKFIIYGNPRDQRARDAVAEATRNPDDSVFLEVAVREGADERFYNLDAVPPTTGRPDWTWGEVADPNLLSPDAAADHNSLARRPLRNLVFPLGGTGSDTIQGEVLTETGGPLAEDLALMGHKKDCSSADKQRWVWVADTGRARWIPLHMETQRNRSSMKYKWNSTGKTKLQMVYGVAGDFKGTAYKAGFSFSTENATGVSYTKTLGNANNTSTRARYSTTRAKWSIWRQKKQCQSYYYDSTGSLRWRDWHDTTLRRDRMRKWEGDVRTEQVGDYWNCNYNYRAKVDGEIEIKRDKTTVWGSYVGLAGLELDASQTNTAGHTLTIWPSGGFAKMAVCGWKDDWPYASTTREVQWY